MREVHVPEDHGEPDDTHAFATALLERLCKRGYQCCVLDTRGDYTGFKPAVVFGTLDNPPANTWTPEDLKALEALVRTYAAETVTTPVRAMLLNPDPLRTNMRRAAMPGEDPTTLKTPEDLAPHVLKLALPSWTVRGLDVVVR